MNHIVIQFNSDQENSVTEIEWLLATASTMGTLLQDAKLGYCSGCSRGAVAGDAPLSIALDDITNTSEAVRVIKRFLTDNEYIGFCKIASLNEQNNGFDVHYPIGAEFNMSHWIPNDTKEGEL